jgi:folylpolyglutamate synthase/dihydrofolate synthase
MSTGSALERSFRRRGEILRMMRFYLHQLDLDLSPLSVIHVAGTKGKGSTCAFADAMLRAQGVRTGMFTSPHLVHVRERFRVGGEVVGEPLFLEHFWVVWDTLQSAPSVAAAAAEGVPPVPSFFRFLTLVAFRLFLAARVDVLLLEVGLGGRLDATNVVPPRSVACVGVATLDLDHVHVLGDTLAEIAYEKAGVFKRAVPAFTQPQPAGALAVLRRCAAGAGCTLRVAEPDATLGGCAEEEEEEAADGGAAAEQGRRLALGVTGRHQRRNAALAVALVNCWLAQQKQKQKQKQGEQQQDGRGTGTAAGAAGAGEEGEDDREDDLPATDPELTAEARVALVRWADALDAAGGDAQAAAVEEEHALVPLAPLEAGELAAAAALLSKVTVRDALAQCRWAGRSHVLALPPTPPQQGATTTLFLDGAHTEHSCACCRDWFDEESRKAAASKAVATCRGTDAVPVSRVLIFYCSHERDPVALLEALLSPGSSGGGGGGTGQRPVFATAIFCPCDSSRPSRIRRKSAAELLREAGYDAEGGAEGGTDAPDAPDASWEHTLRVIADAILARAGVGTRTVLLRTATAAVQWAQTEEAAAVGEGGEVHALVCGSLYMVGSALSTVGWQG